MKKTKTFIKMIIAAIAIVLLVNPGWLHLPADTVRSMGELRTKHFLIDGNAGMTLAHILTLLLAICIVVVIYLLIRFILLVIGRRNNRTATVTTMLAAFLKYVAVIAAVIWGLAILGVDTSAVLAGLGIVGLILGFGAQSLIEDIITGFFIIFEGQYAIGDVIILDDFRGTVTSIGVRTTVITDDGGNQKIVNNSDIRNLQNRSRNNSLAITEIGVAYDTDIRRLEKLIPEGMADIYDGDDKGLYLSVPEYRGIENFADSSIVLRFIVETDEANVFAARRRLNRDILLFLEDKGIEIPFPQVVVHEAGK